MSDSALPDKAGEAYWRERLSGLVPDLAASDVLWLGMTARALERWSLVAYRSRLLPPVIRSVDDKVTRNAWWDALDKAEKRVVELLREGGLTPSSRRRLLGERPPAPPAQADAGLPSASARLLGGGAS